MKKLLKGIVEFREKVRPGYRDTFARLALGQAPDALLIACSDSRVAPNVFASTEPGDLFVIRNVGNLIAPCGTEGRSLTDVSEAAAIEFAASSLRVSDIIVCGHSECGAMRTLMDDHKNPDTPHLHSWLRHAEGALRRIREGIRLTPGLPLHNQFSQVNVLLQVDHLRTYPLVQKRLKSGQLRVHAWWFDIAQAEVFTFDEQNQRFVVIDESQIDRIQAPQKKTRRSFLSGGKIKSSAARLKK